MDLAGTLKIAIETLHRQIESTPYARAIFSGSISPGDYAGSLVQFLHLHEALEALLSRHEGLPCYDQKSMARSSSLRRDIAWWGGLADEAPLGSTTRLREAFESWSQTQPIGLVGALYVFEGSRMGSMILSGTLSRGLGVPVQAGTGLDYHVDGIADRPRTWKGFRESLNALELSVEELDVVVGSAVTTMAILTELYTELPASEARQELRVPA